MKLFNALSELLSSVTKILWNFIISTLVEAALKILGLAFIFAGIWLLAEFASAKFNPTVTWYAVTNSVTPDHVFIEKKPHDCDYERAPLGDKECHYEAVVSKLPSEHPDKYERNNLYVSYQKVQD